MTTTYTDYFSHEGYRKFALQMMLQTVNDILLPEKDAFYTDPEGDGTKVDLRLQAREWVKFRQADKGGARPKGVMFEECIYSWGLASDIDRLRKGFLETPERTREGLLAALSVTRNQSAALPIELEEQALMPSVGEFNTSWLFTKQGHEESAGALAETSGGTFAESPSH